MFQPRQVVINICRIVLAYSLALGLPFALSFAAVYLSRQPAAAPWPESLLLDLGLPVLLGALPALAALWLARKVASKLVRSLYGLESDGEGWTFLSTHLLGQPSGGPFLPIKEGKVTGRGSNVIQKVGGPGALVIYNDSAVVLERAGVLTQVRRGPSLLRLKPFEKIWDIIDLRPQRWPFKVSAITQDGIPIEYDAYIVFKVVNTDGDVFKAATCKWIREAERTEPDRLMIWTKRVIIGETEGSLRSILARYTLDQLIDPACREAVRDELEARLKDAVPELGVEILHVALGDIELRDQVIQQWTETWQAERAREVERIIAEGKAERTRIEERARAEIRVSMLADAARIFAEIAKRGRRVSKEFLMLSFIEMIKRTSAERKLLLPLYTLNALNTLQATIEVEEREDQQPPLITQ